MLELKNVTYTYESKYQKVQALRGVDCTFEGGHVYAVIGKSGSGKTTMLSLIAGLDLPTGGEVLFEGKATGSMRLDDYRRQHVAMIYQSFRLFPLMTAMENVMYPMEMRKVPGAEARKRGNGADCARWVAGKCAAPLSRHALRRGAAARGNCPCACDGYQTFAGG